MFFFSCPCLSLVWGHDNFYFANCDIKTKGLGIPQGTNNERWLHNIPFFMQKPLAWMRNTERVRARFHLAFVCMEKSRTGHGYAAFTPSADRSCPLFPRPLTLLCIYRGTMHHHVWEFFSTFQPCYWRVFMSTSGLCVCKLRKEVLGTPEAKSRSYYALLLSKAIYSVTLIAIKRYAQNPKLFPPLLTPALMVFCS